MTHFKRAFTIEKALTRQLEDGTELLTIAISSETPYLRRWEFGHDKVWEVLGHKPDEVDFSYITEGAPFLFEHDTFQQIGVMRNVRIDDDSVLRADVEFSNSSFARQIYDDMKRGIRTRVSVGYEVTAFEEVGTDEAGIPIVRATRWTPYESSSVSIPADLTVGVNKSHNNGVSQTMKRTLKERLEDMTEDEKNALLTELVAALEGEASDESKDIPTEDLDALIKELVEEEESTDSEDGTTAEAEGEVSDPTPEGEPTEEEDEQEQDIKSLLTGKLRTALGAVLQEKNTMSTKSSKETASNDIDKIVALATRHGMTDKLSGWLKDNRSYESVAAEVLDAQSNSTSINQAPAVHTRSKTTTLGGAVKDWLRGENSEIAERGIDQARNSGRTINQGTLYLPTDLAMISADKVRRAFGRSQRDATVYGGGATGASGVGKEFLTWEETLREGSLLSRVGGEVISLNDIGTVPYFSVPTTASMHAETGSVSNSAVTVGAYTWTPKRIAARYSFSNLMGRLNGTYDFEGELYNDLLAEGVRKFDQQIWAGTGANNITGIQYDTNIGTMGTSGSLSLESGSVMRSVVAGKNANVDNGVFVVAHPVYGDIFARAAFGAGSGQSVLNVLESTNPVYGTSHLAQVLAGKNAAIFGDFSKVTAATFGPVEIVRDNLTALADGQTVLSLEVFADSVVRQPNAIYRWHNIG